MVESMNEEDIYNACLAVGKPYFGTYRYSLLGDPGRNAYMRQLVKQSVEGKHQRSYEILEVGSWTGASAITWASALKDFNHAKGKVVCLDIWGAYPELERVMHESHQQNVYRELYEALNTGKIHELFLHNVRAAGHEDVIHPFKGNSQALLPLFADEAFDIVYLDGSHTYEAVYRDLTLSMRLVKPGGILCGDDLELQTEEIDVPSAIKNQLQDYVEDPRTKKSFHPGVTLAVGETFGRVSAWEGFWAMKKMNNSWEPVQLFPQGDLSIPDHLLGSARPLLLDLVGYAKANGMVT